MILYWHDFTLSCKCSESYWILKHPVTNNYWEELNDLCNADCKTVHIPERRKTCWCTYLVFFNHPLVFCKCLLHGIRVLFFFANRNSCKVATSEQMLYKFRKLYCYNNLSPNMIIPSRNMKTVVTWQIFDWTSHHKSVCSLSVSLCLSFLFMIILFDVIFRI